MAGLRMAIPDGQYTLTVYKMVCLQVRLGRGVYILSTHRSRTKNMLTVSKC